MAPPFVVWTPVAGLVTATERFVATAETSGRLRFAAEPAFLLMSTPSSVACLESEHVARRRAVSVEPLHANRLADPLGAQLRREISTINNERSSGDVARFVARKKKRRISDFDRLPGSLEQTAVDQRCLNNRPLVLALG